MQARTDESFLVLVERAAMRTVLGLELPFDRVEYVLPGKTWHLWIWKAGGAKGKKRPG